MKDLDFIQQASIAAMQGIISAHTNLTPADLAKQAVNRAEALLHVIKGKDYSTDEEEDINERMDMLEYSMDNIILFFEHNCSAWINEPTPQTNPNDKPN